MSILSEIVVSLLVSLASDMHACLKARQVIRVVLRNLHPWVHYSVRSAVSVYL